MNKFFTIKDKRITLTHLSGLLLVFLSSIFLTLLVIYLAPESFMAFMGLVKQNPSLFVLNLIPVLFISVFLWVLFNKAAFSVVVTYGVFIALAVGNSIKISMRQDPVLPTDLTLLVETAATVKTFSPSDVAMILILIAVIIVLAVLVFIFIKSEKINFRMRSGLICGLIVLGSLFNTHVYADNSLYDSFPVNGNIYFNVNQYGSKGLIYSFFHGINTLKVEKPENYESYSFPYDQIYTYNELNSTNKPNIIMVMGEAFSDLSENENLVFEESGYTDPIKNFKQLCAEEDSISGKIVVPNFGGGTSDTEFDVLTGYPTKYLGNTLASYSFVNKPTDSLPGIFRNMGYDTLAVHPGYSWFYNRINVYNHLGFNSFIHLDSFDPVTQNKGGYISEAACMDTVISEIDKAENDDNPLFLFCVTIQNHGPYEEKYNDKYDNFSTSVPLTEIEDTMLNSYFEGIKDADYELNRLVEHLKKSSEPYVLVYFGDHLPGFSNGTAFFDILDYDIDMNGTPEQQLAVYETPFLIWQNDAAKEMGAINTEDVVMPENMTINANYLGALLLEYMGYVDATEYMTYINALRTELPVASNSIYMDINGSYISLDEKTQEKVSYWKSYVYHEMFDKN